MTFEEVLPQIKAGRRTVRKGWSGFGFFIELCDEIGTSEGEFLQVTPYLSIKTSDEDYSMFLPTLCDILAEDWVIIEV